MKQFAIGILLALALVMSASALEPTAAFGGLGWAPCNIAGNYGGHAADNCFVSWDPAGQDCPDGTKDATFTVGAADIRTNRIIIDHLDGIADTTDGFQIMDASGAVLCEFEDLAQKSTEDWLIFECEVSSFYGEQTFTFHPTAESPWNLCSTYGQVAVKGITSDYEDNDVPEFGVIAAAIAMIGAIGGIIVMRRH